MTALRYTKKRKLAILRRMRETLGRPGGWTQWQWERENEGKPYLAYCLAGSAREAMNHLYGLELGVSHLSLGRLGLIAAVRARGGETVVNWNDDRKRTKKDVLALIDEEIARIESMNLSLTLRDIKGADSLNALPKSEDG